MSKRVMSAPAVVAWLSTVFVVSAPAVVAWLVAVSMFGFLHYAANRWLLDDASGSAWSSLRTAALWAVFFGLVMWWSQRRARRRETQAG